MPRLLLSSIVLFFMVASFSFASLPHHHHTPPEEYRDDDYPAKYYAQVLLVVDTTGGLPYPYIALRIEPDRLSIIKYDRTTISELESVSVSTKANTWYKVDVRPVSGGPDSGSLSIQITNNEEAGDAVALLSVSTEELNITSNALGFTMGELAKYEFKLGDYTTALDTSETFIDWTYDAYGRKIAESVYNGATLSAQTLYVWDGWRLLAEVDGTTGNTIAEYVPGPGYIDDIVASCRDLNSSGGFETGEYFYHLTDQQYSTVALLNDTGAVVERYGYDAFGTPLFYEADGTPRTGSTESLVNNPYLYTGQRWVPGLSLYDYRNRMYDPDTGRFITTDLIYDPANLGNPYSYVGNNPGASVDPYGDIVETVWDATSLGIGLGSLGYNLWYGRFLDAGLDTIGIVADAAATAIPFIPGGAGIAIKGYRVAKVAQTLQRVDTAISVGQGVVAGGQAIYEGDTVGAGVAVLQTAIVGSRAAGEIVRNPRIIEKLSDNTGAALNPFAKGALRKAGRETSVITDPARLLPGPSQGKLNAIRGNKFQRSVNAALGVIKRNTSLVSGMTRRGKQINVEPDLLGGRFGVTEIRDRINVSFTRQMQAEYDVARQMGTSYNLVISPRTQIVSRPLQKAIRQSGGLIVQFDSNLMQFSPINFSKTYKNRILR